MNRNALWLLTALIFGFAIAKASYANSNTGPAAFPYYAVIQAQIKAINESGHPIFITACHRGSKRYVLVIPNPSVQGFLAVFHNDDVADMASISESAVKHTFTVEANGGGERNAEMLIKVEKLSKLHFHLVASLSYMALASYSAQMTCDI